MAIWDESSQSTIDEPFWKSLVSTEEVKELNKPLKAPEQKLVTAPPRLLNRPRKPFPSIGKWDDDDMVDSMVFAGLLHGQHTQAPHSAAPTGPGSRLSRGPSNGRVARRVNGVLTFFDSNNKSLP